MPQPDKVDPLVNPLVEAYRNAWHNVMAEQEALASDPVRHARRARLAEMRRSIEREMAELDATADEWIRDTYPKVYEAGAVEAVGAIPGADGFTWSQPHRNAVHRLAHGFYRDLLNATDTVNASTKQLVRAVARDRLLAKAIEGKTAQGAGREMARILQSKGIHAITYSNGAKVGLATYSEMAVRTASAYAYNEGAITASEDRDVKFFEVFDGAGCGWTTHASPEEANGKIVTKSEALAHPISHPNCRRGFGPRPDLGLYEPGGGRAPTKKATGKTGAPGSAPSAPPPPPTPIRPAGTTTRKPVAKRAVPPRRAPVPPAAPVPSTPDGRLASSDVAAVKRAKSHVRKVDRVRHERSTAALEKQAGIVPHSMLKMKEVTWLSDDDVRVYGKETLAFYIHNSRHHEIRLSRDLFRPANKSMYKKLVDSNWFSKCDHTHDAEGTVAHEFGHHVDAMATRWSYRDRVGLFEALADDLGLPKAGIGDPGEWVRTHKTAITRSVSKYAATNDLELLAEIWAEYTMGKAPRPHIKRVGSMMRDLAEKGAVKK